MTYEVGQSIVMGLGRGLEQESAGSQAFYTPSLETLHRANEMATYYHAHPGMAMRLVVSGGFPEIASQGAMQRPPEGISEAAFMKKRLLERKVPEWLIDDEGLSGSTFDNFIKSIDAGFLRPGQFDDPSSPLILAASKAHSWRGAIIARQALAIPHDRKASRVLRLRNGPWESGLRNNVQERVAYALTRLALLEVDAQPGNVSHTREASEWFNEQVRNPFWALRTAGRHIGMLLSMPHVPQVTRYAAA